MHGRGDTREKALNPHGWWHHTSTNSTARKCPLHRVSCLWHDPKQTEQPVAKQHRNSPAIPHATKRMVSHEVAKQVLGDDDQWHDKNNPRTTQSKEPRCLESDREQRTCSLLSHQNCRCAHRDIGVDEDRQRRKYEWEECCDPTDGHHNILSRTHVARARQRTTTTLRTACPAKSAEFVVADIALHEQTLRSDPSCWARPPCPTIKSWLPRTVARLPRMRPLLPRMKARLPQTRARLPRLGPLLPRLWALLPRLWARLPWLWARLRARGGKFSRFGRVFWPNHAIAAREFGWLTEKLSGRRPGLACRRSTRTSTSRCWSELRSRPRWRRSAARRGRTRT